MADYLDYGDPDAGSALTPLRYDGSGLNPTVQAEEDAEMGDREGRSPSPAKRPYDGVKMYPYPAELGIEAGAQRGPQALPASGDQLEGGDPAARNAWNEEGKSDSAPLALEQALRHRLTQLIASPPHIADYTPPEVPSPIGGGQDVRLAALHLTGNPISKLSTSRLFAFVTHYGAQPLGLEWINDTSVNVVFASPSAARLALEYICPAPASSSASAQALPDMSEFERIAIAQREYKVDRESSGNFEQWPEAILEALLVPRSAHRFPTKLYTGIERDYAAQAERLRAESPSVSTIPDDAPDIYREMAAEERKAAWSSPEMDHLKRLQGTIWARFALESADVKAKRAKDESKWYKEHGFSAGKEVVSRMLDVGAVGEKAELLPDAEGSQGGVPKVRGRGATHRTAMDNLDEELNAYRASREAADISRRSASPVRGLGGSGHGYDAPPAAGGSSSSGTNRRGRGSYAARHNLDDEMDQWNAARGQEGSSSVALSSEDSGYRASASSANGRELLLGSAGATPDTGIKVRGRGRHKAPSMVSSKMAGWSDEPVQPPSRMASDDFDEFGRTGSFRARARGGGGKGEGRLNGGASSSSDGSSSSLAQRLGGAPGLPTLEERMQARDSPSLAMRLGQTRER